jgi:hypothetical protein
MTDDRPPGFAPAAPLSPSDERLWSTLIHVGGIFFGFIPALIGYLVLKDRSTFAREHTRTALNFQITWAAVQLANIVVGIPLAIVTFGLWTILQVLIASAAGIVVVVFSIIAAVAANQGRRYTYPLAIPFVR